jgi:hypothetical protein
MKHVFVVLHEYTSERGCDHTKLIGVYSTSAKARRVIRRLRTQPGFREAPRGFAVDRYRIDEDNWVEGFGPAGD